MSSQSPIEVEVKSLLGTQAEADRLRAAMEAVDPSVTHVLRESQLNHYFIGDSLTSLRTVVDQFENKDARVTFGDLLVRTKVFSVRTRQTDDQVIFIVKATVDDTSSENGTARIEFEVPVLFTIDELDAMILENGFEYQAKWSRERDLYRYKQFAVSIDKNAGYGYLSEFERVVHPDSDFEAVKAEIRDEMKQLDLEELPQDRLQRMFEHYNANWDQYYGTEETFTIF